MKSFILLQKSESIMTTLKKSQIINI